MYNNNVLNVYAAYNRNDSVRIISSSGAIFSALVQHILSLKGIVYGVAMSEDCRFAEYKRAEDITEALKFYGSKYLQAKLGKTLQTVKKDLESGKIVLFTGVSCQINGLKMYLGREYPNLYCVDVICHGIPSPALWRKYVSYIESKTRSKMVSVNFRCKDQGWKNYGMKGSVYGRKEIYIPAKYNPYMQMFLKDYCLRPSCYECIAKKDKKCDITIADFWGIENVVPEMNDNKGVSLVIVRTAKGQEMFDNISSLLKYQVVSYEDGIKNNPAEHRSAIRPPQRDTFFIDMNLMNFSMLNKKYLPISLKEKVKRILLNTPIRMLIRTMKSRPGRKELKS